MRSLTVTIALLLPLLSMSASAQVYSWKDANGRIHYSDQPPTGKSQAARTVSGDSLTVEDGEAVRKQIADKRLEANQKAKADKEAAEKAEKQRLEDEKRAAACERARRVVQGLESGQIRFRSTGDGREALDDAARESELASAREAAEENCSPRPAAKK